MEKLEEKATEEQQFLNSMVDLNNRDYSSVDKKYDCDPCDACGPAACAQCKGCVED